MSNHGRRVTAIGGGHGLATTLRALRQRTDNITAIVSVADDGGSSGRLRVAMGLPAVGDLRKCLAALAHPDSPLAAVLDHRFDGGELDGHAFGNLLVAALSRTNDDLETALADAGQLCEVVGRVLPATTGPAVLIGTTADGRRVEGQVNVMQTAGIVSVEIGPADAQPPDAVIQAILDADQVVVGPGSLFTSVLAALVVPGISDALLETKADVVFVCNLAAQPPETADLDVAGHVAALHRHGVRPDHVLHDPTMLGGSAGVAGAVPVSLVGADHRLHDPALLAEALWNVTAEI